MTSMGGQLNGCLLAEAYCDDISKRHFIKFLTICKPSVGVPVTQSTNGNITNTNGTCRKVMIEKQCEREQHRNKENLGNLRDSEKFIS